MKYQIRDGYIPNAPQDHLQMLIADFFMQCPASQETDLSLAHVREINAIEQRFPARNA